MKKIYIGIAILLATCCISNAQKFSIPDTNFRDFLANTAYYSDCMDGDSLIIATAALKSTMVCTNQEISDFTGLEYFTGINECRLVQNPIEKIPSLSTLTNCTWLDLSSCGLDTLPEISGMLKLRWLYADNNTLSFLPDLSPFDSLRRIEVDGNDISSIPDLSSNVKLERLNCQGNVLTSLPDLSNCPEIIQVYSGYNQISGTIDISNNGKLRYLQLQNNEIDTILGIENCDSLETIDVSYNNISITPDFSNLINLTSFSFNTNNLTEAPDVSNNLVLKNYDVGSNNISTLPDLSGNSVLEALYISGNKLDTIQDLSGLANLATLHLSYNNFTYLPDLSNYSALNDLNISYNYLDFSDAREIRIADTVVNSYFYYAPQKWIGEPDTLNLYIGDTLILFTPSQDSATSYQWYSGYNQKVNGATDTMLIITDLDISDNGDYYCRINGEALLSGVMNFGPGISFFETERTHVTVVEKLVLVENSEYNIQLFPNPASNYLMVEINEALILFDFKMYDITGKKQIKQTLDIGENLIDIGHLSSGIYLYSIVDHSKNKVKSGKLIIE